MIPEGRVCVEWERGKMTVILDAFFPAPIARMRKLMKIVRMSREDEGAVKRSILDFLEWRVAADNRTSEALAKEYLDHRQRHAECLAAVTSGERPNGLPLSKEELRRARAERDRHRREASAAEKEYNRLKKRRERTEANADWIRKNWK